MFVEAAGVRPEDMPIEVAKPEAEISGDGDQRPTPEPEDEPDEDASAPLSERLVLDLTALRTAALRDALVSHPDVALTAVVHALTAATFYAPDERASFLEIKVTFAPLDRIAPDIVETRAGRVAERHERWAVRLPREAEGFWAFVVGLPATGPTTRPSPMNALTGPCTGTPRSGLRPQAVWRRRLYPGGAGRRAWRSVLLRRCGAGADAPARPRQLHRKLAAGAQGRQAVHLPRRRAGPKGDRFPAGRRPGGVPHLGRARRRSHPSRYSS